MPVPHDLLADLNISHEAFNEKKKTDAKLNQLHKDYEAKDKEVLAAESTAAADERLNTLRKERNLLKTHIVEQLKHGHH